MFNVDYLKQLLIISIALSTPVHLFKKQKYYLKVVNILNIIHFLLIC